MNELLKADEITKEYVLPKSRVQVLKGASFSVSKGESLAIVGVSGAGKSTLLHLVGGLGKPDSGKVHILGDDLYRMSSGQRTKVRSQNIGFVFQSYHLMPEMDVLENVMVPLMARPGTDHNISSIKERAMDLLASVGLADRATHTPMELSGGEQQRVAIARALINDPEVVLADEPTGNLDEKTGGQVLDSLFNLIASSRHALVLVTHNKEIAHSCDRTLLLRDGFVEDV